MDFAFAQVSPGYAKLNFAYKAMVLCTFTQIAFGNFFYPPNVRRNVHLEEETAMNNNSNPLKRILGVFLHGINL